MPEAFYDGPLQSRGGFLGPAVPNQHTVSRGLGDALANMVKGVLYDPAKDPDRQRAQLLAAQRGEIETERAASERAAAIIAGLKTPEQVRAATAGLMAEAVRGGAKGKMAEYILGVMGGVATNPGQMDTTFVGAGGSPSQTMAAEGVRSADRRYDVDSTARTQRDLAAAKLVPVIGEDGRPVYTSQGRATGQTPVLSNTEVQGTMAQRHWGDMGRLPAEEQRYLSVDAARGGQSTPRNYLRPDGRSGGITLDGLTDAASGEAIPQGSRVFNGNVQTDTPGGLTTARNTDVQRTMAALHDFQDVMGLTREVAAQDPTLFGAIGNGRRLWQGVVQQGVQLKKLGINDLDAELQKASQSAAKSQIDPHIFSLTFDPNLEDIEKLSTLMAYKAAAALAEQEGRSVSNADFVQMRGLVGDPKGWLSSQKSFLSGMEKLDRYVKMRLSRLQMEQGGGAVPGAAPPAGGTPQKRIKLDLDGNIIQ